MEIENRDSFPPPLPPESLRLKVYRKQLGGKIHLYRQKWLYLKDNTDFLKDLARIRTELKMPDTLKFNSDLGIVRPDLQNPKSLEGFEYGIQCTYSQWVRNEGKEFEKQFTYNIHNLIWKYDLPFCFVEHVRFWTLYRDMPKGYPNFFGEEWVYFENPLLSLKRPINKTQIRRVVALAKENLGMGRGRPKKEHEKIVRNLIKLLSAGKEEKRGLRATESAVLFLDSGKKYLEFVAEYYDIYDKQGEISTIYEDKKRANRLRQQVSRLRKNTEWK